MITRVYWNESIPIMMIQHIAISICTGCILGKGSADERRCYIVTSSLIGWAHTQILGCILFMILFSCDCVSQHHILKLSCSMCYTAQINLNLSVMNEMNELINECRHPSGIASTVVIIVFLLSEKVTLKNMDGCMVGILWRGTLMFSSLLPEQNVKQEIVLPTTWDAMTPLWRYCNE